MKDREPERHICEQAPSISGERHASDFIFLLDSNPVTKSYSEMSPLLWQSYTLILCCPSLNERMRIFFIGRESSTLATGLQLHSCSGLAPLFRLINFSTLHSLILESSAPVKRYLSSSPIQTIPLTARLCFLFLATAFPLSASYILKHPLSELTARYFPLTLHDSSRINEENGLILDLTLTLNLFWTVDSFP